MTTDTEVRPVREQTRNTVGIIALITAIVGAIFAMIPGALILGWILLPIAFILSIVALFLKDQKRGQGIAALIISIVGTLIGIFVFIAVVGSAFDDAFNEETQIQAPAGDDTVGEVDLEDGEAGETDSGDASEEAGTRGDPLPLGTAVQGADWEVTVNSVDLDATETILAENPLNEEPDAGNGLIMANLTVEYLGADPDGDTPWVDVEFVSSSGNSYDGTMDLLVVPDAFDPSETLYEGASSDGNIGMEVPLEDLDSGTLRVAPHMFGDPVFFAVQ